MDQSPNPFSQENEQIRQRTRRARRILFLWVAIITLVLIAAGWGYYRLEEKRIRADKYEQLAAIADLKVDEIERWRQERLVDVQLNANNPFISSVAMQWISQPRDLNLKTSLLDTLRSVQEQRRYQNILIAKADGKLVLSVDAALTELDAGARALALEAIVDNEAVFGDFSRDPSTGRVFLDVAAPILDEDYQPAAALILRTDPEDFLYPLIQSWPMPSASAETLLVRRDGDYALYLNTLRHRPDDPLTLRFPLDRTDTPAVQAVLGKTGLTEGVDYRGVPVLADLRPVPGSRWFMVAKVNKDEILAEATYHGQVTLVLAALVILITASVGAFFYSYRQSYFYQRQFRSERERRQANEEIRATLYGIGDGVIATDGHGRVTRLNRVAEELTGWREAEALGLPLEQVFRIISEDTRLAVPNPVEMVLREGRVVGLANHTLLISRDGTERAIADSAAPIRDEDQTLAGVVLVFRDQEKERAIQNALQSSQKKFMTIFQASPDAILLTSIPEGLIIDANPAATRITGYAREELLGHSTVELGLWVNLEERQDYTERVKTWQVVHEFETTFRVRSGSQIAVTVSGEIVQIENGRMYLSVVHDISIIKQAEQEAREKEALLRALINNAPFEIWARDNDEICIMENAAKIRRIGSTLGKRPQESNLPDDEMEKWLSNNRNAYEGNLVDQEVCYKIDGKEHYFNLIIAPIFEGKTVRGIVGFNIDITARKLAEQALALEKEELARSNAELEQFAYVASHDLQEPLRMVSSYMQLIETRYKGKLDQDADEFIAFAVDGAVRMQRLISDLLMFSRIGTRGKPFNDVALEGVMAQACQNLQMSIEEQKAEITSDALPVVTADGSQLVQLFQNLLGNAIKFHGEQPPRIHVSVTDGPDEWTFAVSDKGIGIDPQYAERIFVLFQRLHSRSVYPGTGIGLAICKKIVQRHGGRIWVQSQPGEGATFYFTLPKNKNGQSQEAWNIN